MQQMPGRHASFARDHEYNRQGTLSLLAGIDLLPGKVHALDRERHRSRELEPVQIDIAAGHLLHGSRLRRPLRG